MAAKLSRDTLIHCEACGEDYSSTYRSCPFCGARNDPRRKSGRDDPKSSSRYIPTPPPAHARSDKQDDLEDTYIFDGQDVFDEEPEDDSYAPRPKGGKRLAPREGGGFELPPVNWPRLITFLCSLVIIVAALVIVFTFIYPQLHANPPKPDESAEVSVPPSQDPVPIGSTEPDPVVSDPVAESDPPVDTPPVEPAGTAATVVNASVGLRVRSGPGTSYGIVSSLRNGDPITVLAPADNGWYNISFSGGNGSVLTGYIMGDYISTISGGGTTADPPAPVTQTPGNAGGNLAAGQTGTIVNASVGLRVRSGPGTQYEILDSLVNGNTVTIVSAAENGWYQIRYSGNGGVSKTGYIKGDYISVN